MADETRVIHVNTTDNVQLSGAVRIPEPGEPVFNPDTGKFVIGDGTRSFGSLPNRVTDQDVGSAISNHDANANAHNDIRQLIPDVSAFITTNDLPDISGFITYNDLPDVSGFITANDLPDVSGFLSSEHFIAPTEKVQALGNVTGARTIDCALGNIVTLTATGNITFTLAANAPANQARVLTLIITNGGAFTITWPATVDWGDGAPVLEATGVNILTFVTVNNGTTWLGMMSR